MALTFGFYDSVNHDRVYSARHFNQFLDGVLDGGIFRTIGNHFTVTKADGENWKVVVSSGKAFLNGIWTYNDSDIVLDVDPRTSSSVNRIDSVVLKIDETSRTNSIEIKKGTDTPTSVEVEDIPKPELINTDGIHEYRLANILIRYNWTFIQPADITTCVGTEETPWSMFSDLPYATNYTYGGYNAGSAASSGTYDVDIGIDPKYVIIFGQKSGSSSVGYYPAAELFKNGVSSLGNTSLMILRRKGSSTDFDWWVDNAPYNDLRTSTSGMVTVVTVDEQVTGGGRVRHIKLRFGKQFWPGYGYRSWLAIGNPIVQP